MIFYRTAKNPTSNRNMTYARRREAEITNKPQKAENAEAIHLLLDRQDSVNKWLYKLHRSNTSQLKLVRQTCLFFIIAIIGGLQYCMHYFEIDYIPNI